MEANNPSTEMIQEKKEKSDAINESRKTNAKMYKALIKKGMSSKEALKQASEVTGVTVSQETVLRDYKKYFEN
ncbi:MAG: hypothetical protein WB014_14650 [Methanosarcina sp.]